MRTIPLLLLLSLRSIPALAQSDALTSVQTRADTWRNVVLQEKIFLHADRSFYLAGELLWCRLYCVDGDSHRPSDVSKLAYVELLDRDNKPLLQVKIALAKGFGDGCLHIPPSIPTGIYRLRAYTNWMKNFGPETFFTQTVSVINTIKGVDTAALEHPDTTGSHYTLSFFPEGGDLVANLPSTLAFEALDEQGNGLVADGALLTSNNDTIATLHPQQEGMGFLLFTPKPGLTYKAILNCPDGKTRTWPIPQILPHGYTLHLADDGGPNLKLIVRASEGLAPQNCRLFIHSRTRSSFTGQPPTLSGDSASFIIEKNTLPEGNTRFTLFDAAGRPQAERLFFIPPHTKLNITAATKQANYTTRQKVHLDIGISNPDTSGNHLSIAVYRLDSLQGYPQTDILRYLWTSSEWTGTIPVNRIFDDPELAHLYALTHGWTRFRWTDVLSHPSGPRLFAPEIRGQFITGRLSDPQTGLALKATDTWISTPGLTFQFGATQTDSTGKFLFDIKDFFGSDGIVVHTETPAKVQITSPFSEQYAGAPVPPLSLSSSLLPLLTRHSIAMQVLNVYSGDSLNHFITPPIDTIPFFSKGAYTYLMDNYTRFTSIEEILREYIREINVTHQQGHLHLTMLNEPMHSVFSDNKTLVLLDGVPVPDDRIFSYDALKIKKLDVIPREYILGPAHFSGIASFTTFRGDYEGLDLDPNSLQIEYDGMQYRRQFYAPAYNTNRQAQTRLPDFRNLLYWSPDLRPGTTAAPVEFFTSDVPGDYLVVVQGLSADGRAGVTYTQFTVKPHHPIP
ncbi:MAG TPA: hypothetical protein VHE34_08160 [Puia sp.]|uniref:hypothetical protein n=1 Tax=Puia sp. TaxID=2045100 RepID=UPI002BF94DD2|nr:hypothetical protein [Puia sp.]HVU95181.1 hypothetical protein [Puia sp.]